MLNVRAAMLAILVAGCGDNLAAPPDADIPDAPMADAAFAPAAHYAQPQGTTLGGPTLSAPNVVPIFFTGDSDMQGQIEGFLDALPGSHYWNATTSEYAVGDITIQPSIVSSDTPPTTDDALQAWIVLNSDGLHGWPANTPNTIYTVFLPDGVVLTAGGSMSCSSFGGYHDETQTGSVIYALLPRCQSGVLGGITPAISHELVEASTDPFPETMGAYQNTDAAHAIWGLIPGGELGDMCEFVDSAYDHSLGSYLVQRTWSNTAAATGHDPCVPQDPATAYRGAVPLLTDHLPFTDSEGNSVTTDGVAVATGTSRTVEIDMFSDIPTDLWQVEAIDVASRFEGSAAELQLSLDHNAGKNGDKLNLTIHRIKAGQFGGSVALVESFIGGNTVSEFWVWVSN